MDVKVDGDVWFSAFALKDREKRMKLGPWEDGPGWRKEGAPTNMPRFIESEDNLVSQDERRREKFKQWDAYATKMGRHIPRVVYLGKVTPEPIPGEDSDMNMMDPDTDETRAHLNPTDDAADDELDRPTLNTQDTDEEEYDLQQFMLGHGPGGRPWSEL